MFFKTLTVMLCSIIAFLIVGGASANPMCSKEFWKDSNSENVLFQLSQGHSLINNCEGYNFNAGFVAVRHMKNPALLDIIMTNGLTPNSLQADGKSLLHAATLNDNVSLVESLISRGTNPNFKDKNGITPILTACERAVDFKIIDTLKKMGAKTHPDKNGQTCLYKALSENGRFEIIKYILENGFSHSYDNCKESTDSKRLCEPAISAYINGFHFDPITSGYIDKNPDVIDLLVKKGFDVNARSLEEPSYFSKGGEVYSPSTPLTHAIKQKNKIIINALLNAGADINQRREINNEPKGNTPIFFAIKNNPDPDLIAFLVFKGADLNILANNTTPLHEAIYKDKATVKILLALGIDPELRDGNGNTPLLYASENGRYEIIEFLIGYGANINAVNEIGQSALHHAVKQDSLEILKLIVNSGANKTKVDSNGYNILHTAAMHTNNPFIINYLVNDLKFNVNSKTKDNFKNTPLILSAVHNSRVGIMRQLLTNGADPNITNAFGAIAVHAAAVYSPDFGWEWGTVPDNPLRLRLLVEAGSKLNETYKDDGSTALHEAAKNISQQAIIYLLESGADPKIRNSEGKTPLDIYLEKGGSKESGYRGKGYWKLRDATLN